MNCQTAEPKPTSGLTVLIADDHTLVRDGLRSLVCCTLSGVRVLEAGDGDALVRAVASRPPVDLALVDLNMPNMGGGYRLAEMAHQYPALPVVVISAMTSPEVARRTLQIPTVHAFVAKSAPSGQIGAAIDAALQGIKLPFAQRPASVKRPELTLSPRMEQVRQCLQHGLSNKQIAARMGISEGTVKNYMSEIFKVLQVSNRTQAAQLDVVML